MDSSNKTVPKVESSCADPDLCANTEELSPDPCASVKPTQSQTVDDNNFGRNTNPDL